MPTGQSAASRRWLLPQERWFNQFFISYSVDPPLPPQVRLQQNYGPGGMMFFAAAACDGLAGAVLGIPGVLLASIAQRGVPAAIGYWLAGIGVLSGVLGVIRTLQMARTGRAFRAGRPFIRPGQPLR